MPILCEDIEAPVDRRRRVQSIHDRLVHAPHIVSGDFLPTVVAFSGKSEVIVEALRDDPVLNARVNAICRGVGWTRDALVAYLLFEFARATMDEFTQSDLKEAFGDSLYDLD